MCLRRIAATVSCALLFPLMGCLATQKDVEDAHQVTQEGLKETHDSLTRQHQVMHPEAQEAIDNLDAVYKERFGKVEEALIALESRLGETAKQVLGHGLEIAARFAGMATGLPVVDIAKPISEELKRNSDRNELVLSTLREELSETRERVTNTESTISRTNEALVGVESKHAHVV